MINGAGDIGFIFDWDGVVVDSSSQHELSWERLAEKENLPLFEGHFEQSFGKRNEWVIPGILKWTQDSREIARLSAAKERLYRSMVKENGLNVLPGLKDFLKALRENGYRTAVGSSTPRANIDAVLSRVCLEGRFQEIVAAEDVSHGKPNPEVFLAAANQIGAKPEKCVVFEDSFAGIEAGLFAGMKVVGLATTHSSQSLLDAGVSIAIQNFEKISLTRIQELFSKRVAIDFST